MSGPTPATIALARLALRRAELELLEAQMAEGMAPKTSAAGVSDNATISVDSASPPTQLALGAVQETTSANGCSAREAGTVAENPAGEETEASRIPEQPPAEGGLDWSWIIGERQTVCSGAAGSGASLTIAQIDGRDVGPTGADCDKNEEAGTMIPEEGRRGQGRDVEADMRSDETGEPGATLSNGEPISREAPRETKAAEQPVTSGNRAATAEGSERAENTTANIAPAGAQVPPGSAADEMDVDNDTVATPAQEDATEVIEIDDEGGEVESGPSRGMTVRDFSSRVYRLGSLASSLSGQWQTFTTMWTSVGAFEGAHDWINGPSRLPTRNARSISTWQSKRRLAATLEDEGPESRYVARVAQMYHGVRGMPFEAVARMYGRYGLIGIAYGLTQAYALEPLDGLEVIALDFVDLLAAIRDVRLGRTVSFDTSSTVEQVLASLDPESAAAAVAALARFMSRLRRQPKAATPPPPPPPPPPKTPRKRDRDDKGGAGTASSSGSSSKRAKVKSSSPEKKRSTKT